MSASTTSTASHTLRTFRPLACSPRLHQDEERLKSPTKPAPRPSPRSVRFRTKIAIDRCGPSPRPSPAGPPRRPTPASAQPQAECPSTGARAHNRLCQPDEDERDRSRAGEAGAEAPRAGSRHLSGRAPFSGRSRSLRTPRRPPGSSAAPAGGPRRAVPGRLAPRAAPAP